MVKTASPLRSKRVPKSVSAPTETAAAAAAVAESAESTAAPAPAPAAPRKARKTAPAAPAPALVPEAAAKPAKASAKSADKSADKPAKAPKAPKPKPKLVRDSFTIPKNEYQVLDALKQRALGLEQPVRKSELLRAGIQALAALNDRAFLKALSAVPTLKTGRPKAD